MAQPQKSPDFDWQNYMPEHRSLIALRYEQSKRLHVCSVCKRHPIALRKVLIHQALRSVGAETLDPQPLIRSLALCREHASLSDDALADAIWPGWRPAEPCRPSGEERTRPLESTT